MDIGLALPQYDYGRPLPWADVVATALEGIGRGEYAQPRPTGALPVPEGIAAAVAARRSGRVSAAQQGILDCVAAVAKGDLAEGLAFEARRFADLMASDGSRALRHGFFGRRAVARIPGLTAAPAEIRRVTGSVC